MFKKRRNRIFIYLIIAILIIWFLFFRQKEDKTVYEFYDLKTQNLTKTLDVDGIINAKRKALVHFALGGKITSIKAKEGDFVKKGQVLAIIDRAELQKRLEKSLNFYEQSRLNWDQQLDDIEDRAIDKRELRNVENNQINLNNSVIDVELIDIAMRDNVLRAPFSGIIVKAPADAKNIYWTATDGFELIDLDSLYFKAFIDEVDLASVYLKQRGQIEIDAYEDKMIDTMVKYIGYQGLEGQNGTIFMADLLIPRQNSLEKYRLNMRGKASLKLTSKNDILAVPMEALGKENDSYFLQVWQENNKKNPIKKIKVTLGMETENMVEVISDELQNDQKIVLFD
jgi:macrolide-specific efflux system membrane fusion protein